MGYEHALDSAARAATLLLTPLVLAAVSAAACWLAWYLRRRTRNEALRELLDRLDESVTDSVKSVNQQAYELLGRPKRVDNPNVRRLTHQESTILRNAAVKSVTAYWGLHGLRELARALRLQRSDDDKTLKAVRDIIETKIEAAVSDEKKRAA